MKPPKPYDKQTFISLFNSIARHYHRYTVFTDFVTMSAISLHNAINKLETLENEYLQIVSKYKKDEVDLFCELLANFVQLLDVEPRDVLGSLYMELELGNTNNGQFFTPHELSLLLAKLSYGDMLENFTKPFVTLSEPACGAGGMVLAFANEMLKKGHNPAEKLWVQAIDIDRVAAWMCYLQLSLWNIPAQVIVGNTLSMKFREIYYTPAHYLYGWEGRLQLRESIERVQELCRPLESLEKSAKHETKARDSVTPDLQIFETEETEINDPIDQPELYKNKESILEPKILDDEEYQEIRTYQLTEAELYAEASQHPILHKNPEAMPVIPAKITRKKEIQKAQQMDLFDLFVEHDD